MLSWAAQSPDLNPIEHVWCYIKLLLKNFQAKNIDELKEEILRIWNNIPLDFIQKLIDSIHRRAYDVFKNNGGHSKY